MSDKSVLDALEKKTSRRAFLRDGSVVALVAGVATSCKPDANKAPAAAASGASASGQTGGTMGPNDTSAGAKTQSLEALEIAPSFERAQDLLLKLSE